MRARHRTLVTVALGTAVCVGAVAVRRLGADLEPRPPELASGAPNDGLPRVRHSPAGGPGAYLVGPAHEPAILAALAAWDPPAPRGLAGAVASLWAAPMTLLGLAVALASGARPLRRGDGWCVVSDRGPMAWWLRRRGFTAVTFGQIVLATREPSDLLWEHEAAHIRQTLWLGPLMGVAYPILHAVYGYARNPFERGARAAAAARTAS